MLHVSIISLTKMRPSPTSPVWATVSITFTVGSTITTVATNTTAATQNNLYRGVTYFFRVRAISNGGASAWSNVFSIVTP